MTEDNPLLAFPIYGERIGYQLGMTLRDYFAAKAMQGDMSAQSDPNGVGLFLPSMLDSDLVKSAIFYYRMADAMMTARNSNKVDTE